MTDLGHRCVFFRATSSETCMTVAFHPSETPIPDFEPSSVGSFLLFGERGWPAAFVARLGDAPVQISGSRLRLESQRCEGRCEDVRYVRIALDVRVGGESGRELHIEDLFPARILDVLHTPLNPSAAERVRVAIEQTMLQMDPHSPACALVSNCLAPIRLYDPILDALIAPPPAQTLVSWIAEHLPRMLQGEDGEVLSVETERCSTTLRAVEIGLQHSLRHWGELRMSALIETLCPDTRRCLGSNKVRVALLEPSTRLAGRAAPSPDQLPSLAREVEQWRDELRERISEHMRSRPSSRRLDLTSLLPKRSLLDRLLSAL
jgi:hypothetical protein